MEINLMELNGRELKKYAQELINSFYNKKVVALKDINVPLVHKGGGDMVYYMVIEITKNKTIPYYGNVNDTYIYYYNELYNGYETARISALKNNLIINKYLDNKEIQGLLKTYGGDIK